MFCRSWAHLNLLNYLLWICDIKFCIAFAGSTNRAFWLGQQATHSIPIICVRLNAQKLIFNRQLIYCFQSNIFFTLWKTAVNFTCHQRFLKTFIECSTRSFNQLLFLMFSDRMELYPCVLELVWEQRLYSTTQDHSKKTLTGPNLIKPVSIKTCLA